MYQNISSDKFALVRVLFRPRVCLLLKITGHQADDEGIYQVDPHVCVHRIGTQSSYRPQISPKHKRPHNKPGKPE